MNATQDILASGAVSQLLIGPFTYFRVKSATAAFQLQFDNGPWLDAIQNDAFGPLDPVHRVSFRAVGGVASTVKMIYSLTPIAAQDTAQSNASVYPVGNLGIAVNAAAANGLPACDADGFLIITNAMNLKVSGLNNGHRRQLITFSMKAASPASLNVLDPQGCVVITVLAGQQIQLPFDCDYTLSGATGSAWCNVGQHFLNS